MNYLSVCSGIEAATAAWSTLGWQAVAFSEIEKFPCAALAHHYPNTPNLGDMTKYKEWPSYANVNVLVGGTPCQSFSVAGLRKGLDDPRGNLMLTYLAIAAKYKPEWLVWENVPGVLSSNGGRDFGTFLGALGQLGYGFAYRILDAQYFGLAQRRKRVFVVGHFGSWQRAAAVLFERHSLQGHLAPSREKGEETAGNVAVGIDEECNASLEHFGPLLRGGQGGTRQAVAIEQPYQVANCLTARTARTAKGMNSTLDEGQTPIIAAPICSANHYGDQDGRESHLVVASVAGTLDAGSGRRRGAGITPECLVVHGTQDPVTSDIAFPLGRNSGQENAVATAIRTANTSANGHGISEEVAYTLDQANGQAVAGFKANQGAAAGSIGYEIEKSPTLAAGEGGNRTPAVHHGTAIRRLTPKECERLQGFPDNFTQIPWRNKAAESCPDGPRHKALGNSMAVPVMRWIGERIAMVEEIQ